MPKTRNPRHGTMQFWPRKRSKRIYARVRNHGDTKEPKLTEFAGYKVGMSHAIIVDNKKTSKTKGQEIVVPVTIIECPPLKIYSVRFYKRELGKLSVIQEVLNSKIDKELFKKIPAPKKQTDTIKKIDELAGKDYYDVRVLVYTQPKLTKIGKKKPELFEIGLGGSKEEKIKYIKENLDKDISAKDILKEGQQLDVHAITTGRGFQGPVKRMGVTLRSHKSEKTVRGPATLGGWKGHGHFMYRVAHAGQTGFHQRTHYNKWLMKIEDDAKKINPKGGFIRYGFVNNPCLVIKGSVAGPKKRLVRFVNATRPNKHMPAEAPEIKKISIESPQGR